MSAPRMAAPLQSGKVSALAPHASLATVTSVDPSDYKWGTVTPQQQQQIFGKLFQVPFFCPPFFPPPPGAFPPVGALMGPPCAWPLGFPPIMPHAAPFLMPRETPKHTPVSPNTKAQAGMLKNEIVSSTSAAVTIAIDHFQSPDEFGPEPLDIEEIRKMFQEDLPLDAGEDFSISFESSHAADIGSPWLCSDHESPAAAASVLFGRDSNAFDNSRASLSTFDGSFEDSLAFTSNDFLGDMLDWQLGDEMSMEKWASDSSPSKPKAATGRDNKQHLQQCLKVAKSSKAVCKSKVVSTGKATDIPLMEEALEDMLGSDSWAMKFPFELV